jgi:hypothetical protein
MREKPGLGDYLFEIMRNAVGLIVLLAVAVNPAWARHQGAHVEYLGGTRPEIEKNAGGDLQAGDEQYLVFYSKKANLRIAYERINLLEYGQKVNRRYAMALLISPMFILSKTRRHFLTVGYTDEAGREQALIFKVEKSDIRAMLVSLEARTGRKVQFQDDEARKAGKG